MTLSEYHVKYKEILEKEDLVDVHRLLSLFQSVTPKLTRVLGDASDGFLLKWNLVKLSLSDETAVDGARLRSTIEIVYMNRYKGFVKSIEGFKEVTSKFAERLDTQIKTNEKELLLTILQTKTLIPSIFELLRDVDALEDEINSIFTQLTHFLDEILCHFESFLDRRSQLLYGRPLKRTL